MPEPVRGGVRVPVGIPLLEGDASRGLVERSPGWMCLHPPRFYYFPPPVVTIDFLLPVQWIAEWLLL
jgi:hypothetical protein